MHILVSDLEHVGVLTNMNNIPTPFKLTSLKPICTQLSQKPNGLDFYRNPIALITCWTLNIAAKTDVTTSLTFEFPD
ncbi:MAG: hypothetical protein HEP71_27115 [Roseivirga sp.]|nr:hypothetical protein [Roseivirga sp.]